MASTSGLSSIAYCRVAPNGLRILIGPSHIFNMPRLYDNRFPNGSWEVRAIGKKGGGRSPNDQRSDALNPNSEEYQDAQDNRSVQLNVESDEEKE